MNSPVQLIFLSFCVFAISACVSPEPVPENSFYRLIATEQPARQGSPSFDGTLVVERVRAFGILRERALLYSLASSPEAVRQHHYHHWTDSPVSLVREQLVRYLRQAGIASHVATEVRSGDANYRLRIEIKQLERVLQNDGSVAVKVALAAELNAEDKPRPLFTREYSETRVSSQSSVLASVRMKNEVLTEIYSSITQDIVNSLVK